MTFTPQVLTSMDNQNSITTLIGSNSTYNGTGKDTTGFNTIILSVKSTYDSAPSGIQVQFSDDNITWNTFYTDTYFSTSYFVKNYLIVKKYYRITYTNSSSGSANISITSRLSTDFDSSNTQNNSITVFDNQVENTLDAFGKLRVTNPQTLLDIRFPGQSTGATGFLSNNLEISAGFTGAGYTGTYSNSKLVMGASGSGYYISQSRNYCVYQPGKSLLILASGVLYPGNTGYTSRIGYFDYETPLTNPPVVRNGLYFEHSNGVYSVNIKNNVTEQIIQSNWNIDSMGGTGPSSLNLDFSKTQLFVIDAEWLGVGRIRFGFYAYGRIQYCHQVTNINFLTQPYTNSINLPINYSIFSTDSGLSGCTGFTQICSTVISEGGYNPAGRPFTASSDSTALSGLTQADGESVLLAMRGGSSNYYHQVILPTSLSAISSSNTDLVLYKLRLYRDGLNFTSIAPTWQNVDSNYSVSQYVTFTSPTPIANTSGSIIVDQGYFFGRGVNSFNSLQDIFNTTVQQLTSNVNNVADVLVLTCQKINTGSTDLYGTFTWQEIY